VKRRRAIPIRPPTNETRAEIAPGFKAANATVFILILLECMKGLSRLSLMIKVYIFGNLDLPWGDQLSSASFSRRERPRTLMSGFFI